MKRLQALVVATVGLAGLVTAAFVHLSHSPRAHVPTGRPDPLAWQNLETRIERALARATKEAEQKCLKDFEDWLTAQMEKANAKGGFFDQQMNYWNERLAAIKWGWEYLKKLGDKTAANRTHQEEIAKAFAALVISPEQVEADLHAISQQAVRTFGTTLGAELEAARVESGVSLAAFTQRLTAFQIVAYETPAAGVALSVLADGRRREEELARMLENQRTLAYEGPTIAKVNDAIAVVGLAARAAGSVSAAVKTLGAGSKIAAGAGYVAAVVVFAAAAYDGFEHLRTYEDRRSRLRGEIEAGLRKFGYAALKHKAGSAVEATNARVKALIAKVPVL